MNWATLIINGVVYKVWSRHPPGPDRMAWEFIIANEDRFERRDIWDGPSVPCYYPSRHEAIRAGIDYLLDGIESEEENE